MLDSSPLGTIVIVDDDANVSELLKCNLCSEGYGVIIYRYAKDVDLSSLADMRMVIADAADQEYSGIDLTFDIKENPATSHIPVIICTVSENEDTILDAFDNGADDFVPKPFSLRELLARVKAILRRHPRKVNTEAVARQTMEINIPELNLSIDTVGQKALLDGKVVPLTKTEYAILIFLIKNQNSFFSRDEICAEVWKNEAGSNARIVDTNISRLRKKLGESGKHIINRYGMGYAFATEIE